MREIWGYSTVDIRSAKKIPFSFIELVREEIFLLMEDSGEIQGIFREIPDKDLERYMGDTKELQGDTKIFRGSTMR
jgi:hypothetical protein